MMYYIGGRFCLIILILNVAWHCLFLKFKRARR